jgi:hypothetical protein
MRVCLSREAETELGFFKAKDRAVGIALEASIGMLSSDANEVELPDGMSIQRVGGLFRRGIRVSRVKYENYFPGVRILFFSIQARNCVYVTGIHSRGDLGVGKNYDFSKEPFTRAQRYWGFRGNLCLPPQ